MNIEEAKQFIQLEADWDWERFRRDAARDAVCALIQVKTVGSQPYEWLCKQAIELTDELIKQLREEKK